MSWRMRVRHHTGYAYPTPARSSYNEARMTPMTSGGQHLLEMSLDITPGTSPLRYVDYWGTVVHAFDVHQPHTSLTVTATAVVETAEAVADPARIGWTELRRSRVRDRFTELVSPSRYVVSEPEVSAVGAELAATLAPVEAGRQAVQWTHDQLDYERGTTEVHTTSAQARSARGGVCQDYTHVALALLRSMHLPARYVSGYVHSTRDAAIGEQTSGESHAWVEFWAGTWLPFDPTSLAPVAERHIAVARGRDYADVRPLSGIYRGPKSECLDVSVQITRLR